jgi:Flp pilus assembly protein TadD
MDSGELGAAAFTLGVAHPTGFPLYLLAGKAAAFAPAGEVALRLNLLSAACAAGACVLAARLARALCPSPGALSALAAAALVALGATFWSQATVTEVYTPSILALLFLLAGSERVVRTRDARWLYLLAFAGGLATGLHASLRIAVAVVALSLCLHAPSRSLLCGCLGGAIAAFAAGAAVQIYLPLASRRDPAVDWGNPETFARLWDHLTAGRIRRAFAAEIGALNWTRFSYHARLYLDRLAEVATYPGLLLAPIGAAIALGASRPLAAALAALLAFDFLFATLVNPMGLPDRQAGIPGQVAAAILVAVALGAAAARGYVATLGGRLALGPALVLSALCAAGALAAHAGFAATEEKVRHGDHAAAELVDASLSQLPPRAVLFSRSDDLSAGTVYARAVEAARPDLLHLVRQHVWDRPYLARAAGPLLDPSMLAGSREERIARQGDILARLARRARAGGHTVAWEPAEDDAAAGAPVVPAGLLFQVEPSRVALGPRLGALLAAQDRLTPQTRRYAARLWDRLGRALSAHPDTAARAEAAFGTALLLDPKFARAWNNLAVLLARREDLASAVRAAARAAALAPLTPTHWANLGLFRLRAGDDAGARDAYERCAALAPRDPRAWVGLGILAARAGRHDEARERLLRALDLGAEGETREDALANLRRLEAHDPPGP